MNGNPHHLVHGVSLMDGNPHCQMIEHVEHLRWTPLRKGQTYSSIISFIISQILHIQKQAKFYSLANRWKVELDWRVKLVQDNE